METNSRVRSWTGSLSKVSTTTRMARIHGFDHSDDNIVFLSLSSQIGYRSHNYREVKKWIYRFLAGTVNCWFGRLCKSSNTHTNQHPKSTVQRGDERTTSGVWPMEMLVCDPSSVD
jgi:hypothetical protein